MRAALTAITYADACEASRRACGKSISKQGFALIPRIRDVDSVLAGNPELTDWVFEVHPEVSFCYWNGREPMEHPKRSGLGFIERFRLASRDYPGVFEMVRTQISRSSAADDDILDALAALWTARRIRDTKAEQLPRIPEIDEVGVPMRMLA
jgi:predicted RNase H-like nuclease